MPAFCDTSFSAFSSCSMLCWTCASVAFTVFEPSSSASSFLPSAVAPACNDRVVACLVSWPCSSAATRAASAASDFGVLSRRCRPKAPPTAMPAPRTIAAASGHRPARRRRGGAAGEEALSFGAAAPSAAASACAGSEGAARASTSATSGAAPGTSGGISADVLAGSPETFPASLARVSTSMASPSIRGFSRGGAVVPWTDGTGAPDASPGSAPSLFSALSSSAIFVPQICARL